MTTIAFRAGVLAADSRCTNGGCIVAEPVTKARTLSDDSLVGFCGLVGEVEELAAWIENPSGDRPKLDESGNLVHVKHDRSVWLYEGASKAYRLGEAEFYAWGSGFPMALAAMHAGASAEEAVRIACLIDPESGGPVQSVRLDSAKMTYNGEPPSKRFGFTRESYVE